MRAVTIHEDQIQMTPAGLSVPLTRHFDGKSRLVFVDGMCKEEFLMRYHSDMCIQEAFPYMRPIDREAFLTGFDDEEWEEMK
jgi:hypothetical protein